MTEGDYNLFRYSNRRQLLDHLEMNLSDIFLLIVLLCLKSIEH